MVTNNFALTLQQVWRDYMDTDIIVVSNDVDVNILTIRVYNGSTEITYSELSSGTITFVKDDGNIVQGNLTIGAASITYTMGTNEIAIPGTVRASIQLYGANDERITPAKFRFRVEADLSSTGATPSTTDLIAIATLNAAFNAHMADSAKICVNVLESVAPLADVKADGITDDSAAFQAHIDYAQARGWVNILIPPMDYLINTGLKIKHGTVSINTTILGYGARLIAGTAGMNMLNIIATGDSVTWENIGVTKIFGLRLDGNSKAAKGIMIGRDDANSLYGLDGVYASICRDVEIVNCNIGVDITDSRMWAFDYCNINTTKAGGICVKLNSLHDVACGDMWFSKCQFSVPAADTNAVCIKGVVTSVAGTSTITGLHFDEIVCYGQATNFAATNTNATFSDIFLNNFVADTLSLNTQIFSLYFLGISAGSGVIQLNNVWINSANIGFYAEAVSGVTFNGGKISSTQLNAVILNAASDCSMIGTKLHDVNIGDNGGGAIKLDGAGNRNKVIGCNVFNATGHSTAIIYIGAAQVKPIVTHNTTDAGVCVTNNVAGVEGTDFIVAGNL
ncbi:MAG: BppU family phage baseplate upper protein [Clostridiaceae bacterium]